MSTHRTKNYAQLFNEVVGGGTTNLDRLVSSLKRAADPYRSASKVKTYNLKPTTDPSKTCSKCEHCKSRQLKSGNWYVCELITLEARRSGTMDRDNFKYLGPEIVEPGEVLEDIKKISCTKWTKNATGKIERIK